MSERLKIGDVLYWFDENRRVYERGPDGRSTGSPIYEQHFASTTIVGDTMGTWIVEGYRRRTVNKKTLRGPAERGWPGIQYLTAEGRADKTWVDSHRHKIRALLDQANADQLRQVAAVLGYVP